MTEKKLATVLEAQNALSTVATIATELENLENLLSEKFEIPLPAVNVTAGKGRVYLYNVPIRCKKNFNSFSWIQKGSYISLQFSEKEKGTDGSGMLSAFIRNAGDCLFDVILNVKCLLEGQKISTFKFTEKFDRLAVAVSNPVPVPEKTEDLPA